MGRALNTATTLVAIAAGAVLGAWSRWGLSVWLNRSALPLPMGTLVANLVGGLLIGAFLGALERRPEWAGLRPFLVTGFLGALTTFSTFSAESLALIQRGAWAHALSHTLAHTLGSLVAAAIGWRLLRG
jgi:CrcB protein